MYSKNIVNFQESTTILNAFTKSLETYWMHHVYIHIYIYWCICILLFTNSTYICINYTYIHYIHACVCVNKHTHTHTHTHTHIYIYVCVCLFIYIYMYICKNIFVPVVKWLWRCTWCNGYRRRKWTRWHEFKSWTILIAFHIALIPLGKVWIQLFSLQLCVNSRSD